MPTLDSALLELGRQLLGCADDELLDAPLDALAGRVDDEVRDFLEVVHEAGEADSLRDLLSPDGLERWTSGPSTPREHELLHLQLRRWLGLAAASGDDDPARLARVAALPRDLEGMLAWARPHGLLEELSRPASEVISEHPAIPRALSLVECALGRFETARGASLLAAAHASEEARAHLLREAAHRTGRRAREALWTRVLPDGPMRALGERLRAMVADTSFDTLHSLSFVPARRVKIDVETGVADGALVHPRGVISAQLFLSGYERRALAGECARCRTPRCLHVRVLAARLLDACLDERDRLAGPLRSFAEVPSWKRFLLALSPDEVAPNAKERLSFRLRIDERVSIGIVAQRAQPDGRWTSGKLISPRTASRGYAEHDRPVLDLLSLATRGRGAQYVPADLAILRALVEHPSVQREGSPEPLRIREETVHVTLSELPEGLVPRVSLGDAPLAPGPRETSYVVHHQPATETLLFAALTPPLRRLLAALEHFRGVLPPESYPALAPWLASIGRVARVSAPNALRGTERPPPARLLLRITPGTGEGIDVALHLRALPLGPLWPPGQGPVLSHGLEHGVSVFVRRDLERERAIAERVIASLELTPQRRLEPFVYRIEDRQDALALLSNAARLSDVLELEWAERARPFSIAATVRGPDLAIAVRKKGQWLGLEGGARLARGEAFEADLAIGKLLEAARRGERFVPVGGDHYVEIERELFERLERAQLCVLERLRAPAMSSAALPFWREHIETESADPATRAWMDRADAPAAPIVLDETWERCLRDYQRAGVRWLLERSAWAPGACLADEMGLGKTVQAIALLDARASLGPALVIAPTSVASNWMRELARFAPHLSASSTASLTTETPPELGPGTVLVTTYDHLLRHQERYSGTTFATQIIDEAQMVKNARTQRAKAVARVDADFRLALSGTPVENRLGDLWSLFQLIAPGLLGGWTRFRNLFAVPIEREQDEERAAALRALVAPFVLRRTKREVAPELPSRTEVVHRVELSPAERDLYDAAVREARRAIGRRRRDDASARSARMLAELTRLRQLACHPRLVVDDARVESSKLHALIRLVRDVLPRGHRILIFSQFTRHLALVREALSAAGATSLYLDGATPAAERARLVERFQSGEGDIFLISLKAGGTGLNLTAADYVVHMDPWWNPAAEDQASDRAHRIGQARPTTIVKLVAQDTIEEKVLEMHQDKRRLADAVLVGSATPLDTTALEKLLGPG